MKTVQFDLPSFWVCPLEYGPDSYGDMTETDIAALESFNADLVKEYGAAWPVDYGDDSEDFRRYHDATNYGVLACNVVQVTFQIPDERV